MTKEKKTLTDFQEEVWDNFQEFRANQKVAIFYLEAEAENVKWDLDNGVKNSDECAELQEKLKSITEEINACQTSIEVERKKARKLAQR